MGTSIRTGIIFSGGIIHEYIDCCEWGYELCFILFIYRVTRKKVYLFLRFFYPNRMIIKLKEFYIN